MLEYLVFGSALKFNMASCNYAVLRPLFGFLFRVSDLAEARVGISLLQSGTGKMKGF
jgi:hypothetical protein